MKLHRHLLVTTFTSSFLLLGGGQRLGQEGLSPFEGVHAPAADIARGVTGGRGAVGKFLFHGTPGHLQAHEHHHQREEEHRQRRADLGNRIFVIKARWGLIANEL